MDEPSLLIMSIGLSCFLHMKTKAQISGGGNCAAARRVYWARKNPHRLKMGKRVVTFSRLSFIGSISYLQVTRTYMRAWMSLKFGQIRRLLSVATDRIMMAKTVLPLFLGCFYPILFILARNDDMLESSEEFKLWPDPTTDCGVT